MRSRGWRAKHEDEIEMSKHIWERVSKEASKNSRSSDFSSSRAVCLENYKTLECNHTHTYIYTYIHIDLDAHKWEAACLSCLLVRLFDLRDFRSLCRRPLSSAPSQSVPGRFTRFSICLADEFVYKHKYTERCMHMNNIDM